MPPDPPDPTNAAALARLRTALRTSGYRSGDVDALITRDGANAYREGWFNPVRRQTQAGRPLDTLVRLFALGLAVPADELSDVPGAELSDWTATGLVDVRRRTVQPLAAIRPARVWGEEALLVCDAPSPGLAEPAFPEFVRGITRPSALLAKLTWRRHIRRALDMGTGEGIQAILASHHCDEVIATDVNPRALAFTRFNLAWNDVNNVELRVGDRFDPVRHEEFDLIVSNPPYVISPAKVASFRDSGLASDTISASTIADAADHLASGGWAFVLAQWAVHDGESWQDRVENWVAGRGCDAWAAQQSSVDPGTHAATELGELGAVDPKRADQQFNEWLRYYDDQGIVGIGTGFVVLRRTDQDPWYRTDELAEEPADDAGDAIATLFDAQDWLNGHSDPGALLDTSWCPANDACLDQTVKWRDQSWPAARQIVRHSSGLRTAMTITDDVREILQRCSGGPSLRSLFEEHWKGRGRAPSAWHEQELEEAFRRLVGSGFLVVPSP